MNNDFSHEWGDLRIIFKTQWCSHDWNRPTKDHNIVIHGKRCIIFFLTRNVCLSGTRWKQTSLTHIAIVAKGDIFYLGIVTSHECEAPALLRHLGLSLLQAQSGIKLIFHDDVIKWKHFPRNWPFVLGIHRSPVNFPHKAQWRGALMFSLICVWINDRVNNREAGDLRRYRAHYDVIVMY